MKAVISGDIIASTALKTADKALVESKLKALFLDLNTHFNTYSRLIKGDYIECVIPKPGNALQIALIFKCLVKSLPISNPKSKSEQNKLKAFKTYGMRQAIGYGTLDRYDPENDIIDGEAIHLSGRWVNEHSTHSKQRVSVKSTLQFLSNDERLNTDFEPLFMLLDVLLNKATSRQCEVAYLKLLGNSEEEIAAKLGIKQPVVNQHSTAIGWNAIEQATTYFNQKLTQ